MGDEVDIGAELTGRADVSASRKLVSFARKKQRRGIGLAVRMVTIDESLGTKLEFRFGQEPVETLGLDGKAFVERPPEATSGGLEVRTEGRLGQCGDLFGKLKGPGG